MSVEDGEKINESFAAKQKQIDSLKLTLDSAKIKHNQYMIVNGKRLQSMYDSYNQELNNHKITKLEADSIKTLYLANKKIYEHREREFRKERINQQIFTMITMIITVLLAIK
jgi:hypothetical protein